MDAQRRHDLDAQVALGGHTYVRNLAAAEAAVLRGQFNLAKVLRALAHSQRAQALAAARLLAAEETPAAVLGTIVAAVAALHADLQFRILAISRPSPVASAIFRSLACGAPPRVAPPTFLSVPAVKPPVVGSPIGGLDPSSASSS